VLDLERRFLNDSRTINFTLHDIIKDNPCLSIQSGVRRRLPDAVAGCGQVQGDVG